MVKTDLEEEDAGSSCPYFETDLLEKTTGYF
jgi:hypothetical protein